MKSFMDIPDLSHLSILFIELHYMKNYGCYVNQMKRLFSAFVSNFNIGHNFWASSDRDLIFGMHVYLIHSHFEGWHDKVKVIFQG